MMKPQTSHFQFKLQVKNNLNKHINDIILHTKPQSCCFAMQCIKTTLLSLKYISKMYYPWVQVTHYTCTIYLFICFNTVLNEAVGVTGVGVTFPRYMELFFSLSVFSVLYWSQLFGTNMCSLTFWWIFLYYSVLLFHNTAIHSRCESHFGREAAQLCMIGCIAVLSHSHRHAFDLSPASKVLSKHCKESLSKCSP